MALLAIMGVAASSASAKAKKLDLVYFLYFKGVPFENQVPVGALFKLGEATGTTFESKVGSITCAKPGNYTYGEVVTNNEPKDFLWILGGQLVSAKCPSTIGLGTEAEVTLDPGLEAQLYLGANRKAEVKAPYAEYPPALSVLFSGGASCYYTAAKLKASMALEPVQLTFAKQKLKLIKANSNVSCPKTMAYNAVFAAPTVTSGGNPLYAHLD